MNIYNANNDSFSPEMVESISILMEGLNAMDILANKMDLVLRSLKLDKNTFHESAKHTNEALKSLRKVIYHLDQASEQRLLQAAKFSSEFNGLSESMNWDVIQYRSNDIIQLLFLYYSRLEVNPDNRERIKKAIRKLKGTEEYDVEEMVNIFKLK